MSNNNEWDPKPYDTSDIELPADLLELTEMLASHTHSVWGKQRKEEGWSYGKMRDDTKKTTPCLVPYEQLSESEKQYDRATALETLKLILLLNYEIKKKDD